ncbi:MFS transporter [Salmonella enterica subsp. enterica serovar Newport]|nr:MFS transporter [Salmonella enterica subsp. enterica serovar Newport]ECX2804771.1 MFS transporter [Salmonella enterica subsp. enterica serovar Newport]
MTRYTTTDVLICGAGVTGLTLAIELARHGVSFRLIEKRTTPFIGSRGKGIQPRTQEIFEDLGILNKVVAAGGLYPRLRTYRHDGSYVDSDIAHNTKPTHAEPYHLPLMVPQNVTETIMREQLKAWGHRVEFGCELRHFAQTPRTVTAYVAGPAGEEVIIAHYLIGADGGGSFVRKKLGVSFPGRTLGIHALVADASLSGLNRDVWHHFNDGDMARMITICPLAGTQLFQIQACYLNHSLHLDIKEISIATVIPWVIGAIGMVLGGVCSDVIYRITGNALLSRRLILGVCLAGAAVCVAVSGTVSTIGSAITLMSVSLFLLYLTGPIYWAVIQDVVHKDKVGSVGGAMHGLANISGIIGPLVTGFIVQFSGKYDYAFYLAGAIAIVSSLLVFVFVKSKGFKANESQSCVH